MSSKSSQELRKAIRRVMRACLSGGNEYTDEELDSLIDIHDLDEPFHSHMQTAFDDVIGENLVDYGGQGEEYKSYVNDEHDEQRRRAAKWLGGDK